ncbi:DUF4118 domain-containing protein [Knoellia sp. S7-12]|uniref:DUF4118 domain-containing protein n=1 Tax=Knoellia sp. S7-12 TaxID=3126698 RepID=UPI003368F418
MRLMQALESRPSAIGAYAVFAPLVVGGTFAIWRDSIPHATVVLSLVVVIVGAAATGIRWAGWGASVSSALWFDWFHTAPNGTLAITNAEDVQVAALLLVVGVAVTELALWGQRWQAHAAESAARLEGLVATARAVADHRGHELIVREVEKQLTALLDLDRATWIPSAPAAGAAVLRRDGLIVRAGTARDGSREGFPIDTAVALPVDLKSRTLGRVDLVASAHVSRPTEASLRVAFLLADQLAAAWSRDDGPRSSGSPTQPDLM